MTSTVWRRNDDWVGEQVKDAFVMMNVQSDAYASLNDTALAIWTALETPCSQADIETELLSAYDVSREDCAASVTTALEKMRAAKLIVPADDSPTDGVA